MAKDAPLKGDGPWGEAIQYWLREKQLRQAHIVEGAGIDPNKVSRAANGLNVRMDTLRQIAEFLEVPFESVLVSPARRLGAEEERLVLDQVAAEARRVLDRSRPTTPVRRMDPRLLGIAKRLTKLSAKRQKDMIKLLGDFEKAEKADRATPHRRRRTATTP